MLKRFIDFCQTEKIFSVNKIVVAVSGGADSLALADLLIRSVRRFKLEICIAHYEHGLRGKDSADDAEFVETFAKNAGVKFFCGHGDVKNFAAEKKISVETAARTLRYEFLSAVRKNLNFDAIALAHHADDQAETILMRLIRGSSVDGLSAMKFSTRTEDYGLLIRPLLRFKKIELENYCRARGIFPRVDATNFETDATRNKIRLELLPALKNFNPAIVDSLCRFAETAAEESDFINSEAEKIFSKVVKKNFATGRIELLREEFLKLPAAVQRITVKKFIELATGSVKDFGFVHFEAVRKVLINGLTGVELPHKLRVELRRGKLTVTENLFANCAS